MTNYPECTADYWTDLEQLLPRVYAPTTLTAAGWQAATSPDGLRYEATDVAGIRYTVDLDTVHTALYPLFGCSGLARKTLQQLAIEGSSYLRDVLYPELLNAGHQTWAYCSWGTKLQRPVLTATRLSAVQDRVNDPRQDSWTVVEQLRECCAATPVHLLRYAQAAVDTRCTLALIDQSTMQSGARSWGCVQFALDAATLQIRPQGAVWYPQYQLLVQLPPPPAVTELLPYAALTELSAAASNPDLLQCDCQAAYYSLTERDTTAGAYCYLTSLQLPNYQWGTLLQAVTAELPQRPVDRRWRIEQALGLILARHLYSCSRCQHLNLPTLATS
jgi:hypothetical protein